MANCSIQDCINLSAIYTDIRINVTDRQTSPQIRRITPFERSLENRVPSGRNRFRKSGRELETLFMPPSNLETLYKPLTLHEQAFCSIEKYSCIQLLIRSAAVNTALA